MLLTPICFHFFYTQLSGHSKRIALQRKFSSWDELGCTSIHGQIFAHVHNSIRSSGWCFATFGHVPPLHGTPVGAKAKEKQGQQMTCIWMILCARFCSMILLLMSRKYSLGTMCYMEFW